MIIINPAYLAPIRARAIGFSTDTRSGASPRGRGSYEHNPPI